MDSVEGRTNKKPSKIPEMVEFAGGLLILVAAVLNLPVNDVLVYQMEIQRRGNIGNDRARTDTIFGHAFAFGDEEPVRVHKSKFLTLNTQDPEGHRILFAGLIAVALSLLQMPFAWRQRSLGGSRLVVLLAGAVTALGVGIISTAYNAGYVMIGTSYSTPGPAAIVAGIAGGICVFARAHRLATARSK